MIQKASLLTGLAAAHLGPLSTSSGGPTFSVDWDATKQAFKFEATVPANMWLGLAFGTSMTNTDMVMFTGTGASGSVTDLWSTG